MDRGPRSPFSPGRALLGEQLRHPVRLARLGVDHRLRQVAYRLHLRVLGGVLHHRLPALVVEVAESIMAEYLRRTISWVDEHVDADGEAEVLAVPSHFLTGLWLKGPQLDAVVIASAPADMPGIELNQLIPGDQFLRRLSEIPAVKWLGLPDDREAPLGAGA